MRNEAGIATAACLLLAAWCLSGRRRGRVVIRGALACDVTTLEPDQAHLASRDLRLAHLMSFCQPRLP